MGQYSQASEIFVAQLWLMTVYMSEKRRCRIWGVVFVNDGEALSVVENPTSVGFERIGGAGMCSLLFTTWPSDRSRASRSRTRLHPSRFSFVQTASWLSRFLNFEDNYKSTNSSSLQAPFPRGDMSIFSLKFLPVVGPSAGFSWAWEWVPHVSEPQLWPFVFKMGITVILSQFLPPYVRYNISPTSFTPDGTIDSFFRRLCRGPAKKCLCGNNCVNAWHSWLLFYLSSSLSRALRTSMQHPRIQRLPWNFIDVG